MSSFERCVVLAVDDENLVLRLVASVLVRHGYVVLSAESGEEALRMSQQREGPIHLALLDVMMPGIRGPELLERLRLEYPGIAALFMSGYSPDRIAEYLPDLAKVHFISKPFRPRDLVCQVNQILGNEDICEMPEEAEVAAR